MTAQIGHCSKCGNHKLIQPLHGDKGGPLTCWECGLEWHAKHARKRKAGRIVVKAIKAYLNAGGAYRHIDRLKLAANGSSLTHWDGDAIGADVGDITTELLEDVIRLTHPDKHPAERQELAHRVSQELIALRPFVFPAPKPEPSMPEPRNGLVKARDEIFDEALRKARSYPCELCADALVRDYCVACKAEWERRDKVKRDNDEAKLRSYYESRRARRLAMRKAVACVVCGTKFEGKRTDARYCSEACRQKAHRKRVTDNHYCTAKKQLVVTAGLREAA
jgi:hypothetical protein